MKNGESSYRRFLDGSSEAFDEIWKEYRLPLTFFINGYLHDLNASEDVAIDVFTYILVHPRRYNFQTSVKTYLFMLGRSRALDYLKRRKKFPMEELSEVDGVLYADSLEEILFAQEEKRAVLSALEMLSSELCEAVRLVYLEGLSYEDAARVMKKNKKQIDNLLYRAKIQLRDLIGKELF